MIQPNNSKTAELFASSNARSGGGFGPSQSASSASRPDNFGGVISKLTMESGKDGSGKRLGMTDGKDARSLLTQPSRADALGKPQGRDGPLHAELKRVLSGKAGKGELGKPQDQVRSNGVGSLGQRAGRDQVAPGTAARAASAATARSSQQGSGEPGDTGGSEAGSSGSEATNPVVETGAASAALGGGATAAKAGVAGSAAAGATHPLHQAAGISGEDNPQHHAGSEGDTGSDADGGSGAEDSSNTGTGSETASKNPARSTSQSAGGNTPPVTTINRLNQRLLTADPRQMLLGLDTLGSRMMISAANANQVGGSGDAGSTPTSAARSDLSADGVNGARSDAGSIQPTGDALQPGDLSAQDAQAAAGSRSGAAAVSPADGVDDSVSSQVAGADSVGQQAAQRPAPSPRETAAVAATAASPSADPAAAAGKAAVVAAAGTEAAEKTLRSRFDQAAHADADGARTEAQSATTGIGAAGSGGQAGQPGGHSADKMADKGGQELPGQQQPASRALAQQVERAVASASRQAERLGAASGPITLRLKPESLGQVRIKLSVGEAGKGFGVKIEVGSTDAQRLLAESMGSLRDALKAKGLILSEGAVGVDPSLAPGNLRQTSVNQAKPEQPNTRHADEAGTSRYWQQPGGQTPGQQGMGDTNGDDRRQGRDQSPQRGGFFDGAVVIPGGTRSAGGRGR